MNIYLGDSGNIGSLSHHWRGIIVILSKLTANNREREKERERERERENGGSLFRGNCVPFFSGALMKFKKHLSFVMHWTGPTQSALSKIYDDLSHSFSLSLFLSLSYSRALPHEYLNWILKAHNHRDSDHLQSRISRQSISKVLYSLAVRNEEHFCKLMEKRVSQAPRGKLMSSHDEFSKQIGKRWGRKI